MAQPMSPDEALKAKGFSIPEPIIAAVNELLVAAIRPNVTTIILKQKDILALAIRKFKEADMSVTEGQIYKEGWMDFEPIFEKVGWKVSYDKPGYCESYEAFFEFSKKLKE